MALVLAVNNHNNDNLTWWGCVWLFALINSLQNILRQAFTTPTSHNSIAKLLDYGFNIKYYIRILNQVVDALLHMEETEFGTLSHHTWVEWEEL